MRRHEVRHRDEVLHDYFEGRGWDENDEFRLMRRLVLDRGELLRPYPYVVEHEWEVVAGRTNRGRGDLVFTDGDGNFAVVEVKFIDLESSGATAQTKRRKGRRAVKEQALRYAEAYRRRVSEGCVVGLAFTNEADQPIEIEPVA